jgi:hypothetical protein
VDPQITRDQDEAERIASEKLQRFQSLADHPMAIRMRADIDRVFGTPTQKPERGPASEQ